MFRVCFVMIAGLTILTGVIYPLAITILAQLLFPDQANGSLVMEHGRVAGSRLLGRQFNDPKYFWCRPSATVPLPYNPASSSGSNLGQLNPELRKAIENRRKALRESDPTAVSEPPIDLLTASGSGLDPHISPEAAEYQADRVAKLRAMNPARVRALIVAHSFGRQVGFLGEPVVNVVALNRALDGK
jgi:K+-transporting ATPase ATPase C chain